MLNGTTRGGLCFGKAQVTAIEQFSEPGEMMGQKISRVTYAYKITGLPDWARPEAQNPRPSDRALAVNGAVAQRLRRPCGVWSQADAPWANRRQAVESRLLFARRLERWQPAAMTESVPAHMAAHVK
ncbi:hypothetical protein MXF29_13800 [Pseudomonas sp. NC26]|uniref:Uncharacterized protein n=1 Tax=Pseudomonas putida TaxID=303 RepID=A0A7W2L1T4_PSEPU|nr:MULTISPECIES: hypothetical protein [Pseudomonas]MBA6116823.1 hypothetical protein [Pseudomonas putida]MCZ9637654.1 hypothetical protein [Pseudomonas putida]MEC4876673.1 hypothetical protein [Pseudomonas sp. NC26]QNL88155.1 Uncharacterized protein PPKH_2741 [Pseudomonas putida]